MRVEIVRALVQWQEGKKKITASDGKKVQKNENKGEVGKKEKNSNKGPGKQKVHR